MEKEEHHIEVKLGKQKGGSLSCLKKAWGCGSFF